RFNGIILPTHLREDPLIYNFHPARIFLGDSGAIFLGFMLASMGLRVANNESLPILSRWMLPILILLVPIFDTSLITISRLKRGLIPFLHPGKDHSHHRLLNLGLGYKKTVLLIYLFEKLPFEHQELPASPLRKWNLIGVRGKIQTNTKIIDEYGNNFSIERLNNS
ncbi:MAG: MraY family glycosyltransferase, partial [Thermodesulfobacteriota bacterium]